MVNACLVPLDDEEKKVVWIWIENYLIELLGRNCVHMKVEKKGIYPIRECGWFVNLGRTLR